MLTVIKTSNTGDCLAKNLTELFPGRLRKKFSESITSLKYRCFFLFNIIPRSITSLTNSKQLEKKKIQAKTNKQKNPYHFCAFSKLLSSFLRSSLAVSEKHFKHINYCLNDPTDLAFLTFQIG